MRFREPLEVAVHCKRGGKRAAAGRAGGHRRDLVEGRLQRPQSRPCPHSRTQARGVGRSGPSSSQEDNNGQET